MLTVNRTGSQPAKNTDRSISISASVCVGAFRGCQRAFEARKKKPASLVLIGHHGCCCVKTRGSDRDDAIEKERERERERKGRLPLATLGDRTIHQETRIDHTLHTSARLCSRSHVHAYSYTRDRVLFRYGCMSV